MRPPLSSRIRWQSCGRFAMDRPFRCPNPSAERRAERCRDCAAVAPLRSLRDVAVFDQKLPPFSGVPVPRLSPIRGRAQPLHQARNSSVPNWLVSIVFRPLSRVRGRSSLARHHRASVAGDEISTPGYRMIGTPSYRTSSATSLRNPFSSERLDADHRFHRRGRVQGARGTNQTNSGRSVKSCVWGRGKSE
jgi:hypothetical protein